MTRKKPTVAGFFAGTGGVELGFQQAGFNPVYSNEWDSKAVETLNSNFEHAAHLEDITKIEFKDIPNTTVITGGFPCQAFSIAGYRKGFEDELGRGNLFFRIAEIVEEKQPEVVFLENVKNLVTHDEGKTFKIILETLKTLGYHVKYEVLNAKDYGNIPQGRERIYIVGFKNLEHYNKFNFPEKIELTTKLNNVIDFNIKMDDRYYYTKEKYPYMFPLLTDEVISQETVYQWRRKYVRANKSGVSPTLTATGGTGGHNVPLVFTQHGIRKLTPRECFNLMGFPKNYVLPEVAHSHLYKQAGNAVVVPVVKRIAENIFQAIK